MKILKPLPHAILDYALAGLFLLAPALFGFSGIAATLAYVIGVAYVATSLLTRYPLGAIKLIPFPVHGVLESIMAAAWIVLPWIFGFAADAAARNFFIVAGVGLLLVALITDYKAAESTYAGAERRRGMDRRHNAAPVARERRDGVDRRARGFAAA